MLAVYVMMTLKGLIKLEQVPVGFRDKVAEVLEEAEINQKRNIV
ncbi:hypothetical protein MKY92_06240 [Paenibacillus sp. FSL R5-0623]